MFRRLFRRLASIARQPRPIRYLACRVLLRTGLCRLFTITFRGVRLRFWPTPYSARIWLGAGWAEHEPDFFEAYLREGDTVIDVGANIGFLALLAARIVGASGRVYAFEPHPRIHGYLCGNVTLNDFSQITVFNKAVGDRQGEVFFSDDSHDHKNHACDAPTNLQVPLDTLDAVLPAGETRIALLKIDAEGYERFVLEGATQTLKRISCVFYEAYEGHFERFGYSNRDIAKGLLAAGFSLYCPMDEGALRPIGEDWVSWSSSPVDNVIATRDVDGLLRSTGWHLDPSPV